MSLDNFKKGTFLSVKKTMADLPNQIKNGEQVKIIICGQIEHNSGVLTLTNKRVFYYSKRLFSNDLTDMPINKIGGVNYEGGIFNKKIKINYSGGDFEMKAYDSEASKEFISLLNEAMNNTDTSPIESVPIEVQNKSNSDDRIAQLESLAKLKADGILNEEEFQMEKSRILNLT